MRWCCAILVAVIVASASAWQQPTLLWSSAALRPSRYHLRTARPPVAHGGQHAAKPSDVQLAIPQIKDVRCRLAPYARASR
jgi:hypothetical protein